MDAVTQRRATVLVVVLVAVMVAECAAGFWWDHLTRTAGGSTDTGFSDGIWVLFVGLVPAIVVGCVIAVTQPRHPVGWLFLALGVSLMGTGPIDGYATYANLATSTARPGADLAALLADREWAPWLVLPALILHLTPDGRFLSARWRAAAWVMVTSALLLTALAVISPLPLEKPYDDVVSPFAIASLPSAIANMRFVCVLAMGVGVIASAVSLVVRFRRSRDDERRQLLWLMVVVVPAPLFVGLAFGGAMSGHDLLTFLGTAGFVTLIPIAAGLSVLRFRLYDVERIVASTITWVLLTSSLVATYAFVVWLGAGAVHAGSVPPELSATVGALAAAVLAFPLRRGLQDLVDRRFNRRSYEARRVIGAALAAEDAGMNVEAVLQDALTDPTLVVAYPGPDDEWVRSDGSPAQDTGDHLDVDRHGRVIARIAFDPDVNDTGTVRRAAALAAAELDNARLRAELAGRLEEIDASRRRLTTAQRTERRRIERDLHDGAQQSLLALAFELQSAQVNGDPQRMRAALAAGAASARDAVRELRELANGLHPAALADGGLSAALDDMARHSPVPLRLDVTPERLDPALEFTAWLVLGEAIVNAQKHAGAHSIDVGVARSAGHLRLRVADDGRGGARHDGPGIRGMRDRVETASGDLTVSTGASGTTIEAVLPCGS
jgi:signal transduction histidine kinase